MRRIFVRESSLSDSDYITACLFEEKASLFGKTLSGSQRQAARSHINKRMAYLRERKRQALQLLVDARKSLSAGRVCEALAAMRQALDIMTADELIEFAARLKETSKIGR